MITPGKYKATIISHAISETKGSDPQATIMFAFEANGPHQIQWFGSFKEKALPITLKALLTCGLKGSNPSGPLEIGRDVSITIDEQVGEDGKKRMKVQWINPLAAIRNIIPPDLAQARLSALEGAVMAARQELNIPDEEDLPDFLR